jgi:hypothetical protein
MYAVRGNNSRLSVGTADAASACSAGTLIRFAARATQKEAPNQFVAPSLLAERINASIRSCREQKIIDVGFAEPEVAAAAGTATIAIIERFRRRVRVSYQEASKRYEYILTQKGLDLYPIIMSIVHWANVHMARLARTAAAARAQALQEDVRSRHGLLGMWRAAGSFAVECFGGGPDAATGPAGDGRAGSVPLRAHYRRIA